MIPEPMYVTTTAMAMPAITAPAPRPSRTKSAMSFIVCAASGRVSRKAGGLLSGPSLGRTHEVAGVHPRGVGPKDAVAGAVVLVELRVVVADGGRLRVLAALEHGRTEDERTLERLHLRHDAVGGEAVRAERVEPLGQRHRLAEADQ